MCGHRPDSTANVSTTFQEFPLSLDAISIPPPTGTAQHLLIICHGWGANAQDVAAIATMLDLPDYHLLFPNAPLPYLYAPDSGRVWYNFPEEYSFLSQPEFYDQPELAQSRQQLRDWLLSLEAVTGVPLSRTILSGFSQGGAMSLDVGVHLPLAAIMALSGYSHAPNRFPNGVPEVLPPIFMVHGRQDIVVPVQMARQTRDYLLSLGAAVKYQELDMGHEIQPAVLQLMQAFLQRL
jgi:phospholipase/carboxylesterase